MGNSMLDWPDAIQTSPTSTSCSVIVLVPCTSMENGPPAFPGFRYRLHRPKGPVVVLSVSSRNVPDTVSFGVAIPQTWTGRFRCTTIWSAKIDGRRTSAPASGRENAMTETAAIRSFLKLVDEIKDVTMTLSC